MYPLPRSLLISQDYRSPMYSLPKSLRISQHYCSPMYSLLSMQHYWPHTVRVCYITYHTAVSSQFCTQCYWLIDSASYMLIKIYVVASCHNTAMSLYNIMVDWMYSTYLWAGELVLQCCKTPHSSRTGDRRKWRSDRAITWDLHSDTDLQPHKVPILVSISFSLRKIKGSYIIHLRCMV